MVEVAICDLELQNSTARECTLEVPNWLLKMVPLFPHYSAFSL